MPLVFARLVASVFAVSRLGAQAVIDSPRGPMEVIGLHRWTIAMLQDSIAAKAPGETLRSHACAAILQQKLGFPSAAVVMYMSVGTPDSLVAPGARLPRTVVTVVEPEDSARVQYLPPPSDSLAVPERWRALARAITTPQGTDVNGLQFVMQFYGIALHNVDTAFATLARFDDSQLPLARAFWPELRAHTSLADRALAAHTLQTDRNLTNRLLAVAVLANFHAQDSTWSALVRELRDPDERVRATAQAVLQALVRQHARPIDWRRSVDDLRVLVSGTNTWAFLGVVELLTQTAVSPDLARPLLAGNFDLVLAHARAQTPQAREPVLALLRQLYRGSYPDGRDWEPWLRSL